MVDNENNVSLCTCLRTHELVDITKFARKTYTELDHLITPNVWKHQK